MMYLNQYQSFISCHHTIYELWMRQHATIEVIRGQIRRLMADFGGAKANFGGRGFLVFLSSTLARSPYISPNIFYPFFWDKNFELQLEPFGASALPEPTY